MNKLNSTPSDDKSLNLEEDNEKISEQKSIFKNKRRIAPDIARTLLVFYELIKNDRPELEGENLYKIVLKTWNLNLSKTTSIKIGEIIEKAKRVAGRKTWGEGINLRRIVYAIALDEFINFSTQEDSGSDRRKSFDEEYWKNYHIQLKKDFIFVIKMEDEIEKIIPEGI